MKLKKGFTLLEILLVIAAIGVLAAIVIVAINPNRQLAQARDAERSLEVDALYKSLVQFSIENGVYPVTIEALMVGDEAEICASNVDLATCQTNDLLYLEGDLAPRYLTVIPSDPSAEGVNSGYSVFRAANGKIGIRALNPELREEIILGPEYEGVLFTHLLPIDIANSGGELLEQDVLLTINTADLITQGIIQNDCDDVAFSNSLFYNDFSSLPFVLAGGCNTSETRFIVKVDEIESGSSQIYAHFGNGETGSLAREEEFAWLEYGSVQLASNYWFDSVQEVVNLSVPFTSPRIISQVMTYNGTQSVVSRVKNVTSTQFDLFMLEDNNIDDHFEETVTWMAVEDGHWLGFDGVEIQSGIHSTANFHDGSPSAPDRSFNGDTVSFAQAFSSTPSVFATLNTYNNNAFMTDVIHQIGTSSFRLEQEKGELPLAEVNPTTEDIAWIAFERGEQNLGDVHYRFDHRANSVSNGVDNGPTTISFSFANVPTIFAQGSTGAGGDGYWMRGADTILSNTQARFYAEEDNRSNPEKSHAAESFSWMALDGDTTIPLASYYDESQISISPGELKER
jgi:prepilin-type N-terminal cleavage/methylation domain-containing protein